MVYLTGHKGVNRRNVLLELTIPCTGTLHSQGNDNWWILASYQGMLGPRCIQKAYLTNKGNNGIF